MYKSLTDIYKQNVAARKISAPWDKLIFEADAASGPKKPKKAAAPGKSYDEVITSFLSSHPELQNLSDDWFKNPVDLFTANRVPAKYMPLWQGLYELTPPKVGEEEGGTKGSGNGEMALYWLLKASYPSLQDNRLAGVGAADLIISDSGTGIEVKAYPPKEKWLKIGKYRRNISPAQKNNNLCLDTIFGLDVLLNIGKEGGESKIKKRGDVFNFNFLAVKNAFESLLKVAVLSDDPVLAQYDLFKFINDNLKKVSSYLNIPLTGEKSEEQAATLANELLFKLIETKFSAKPGNNGYLVNVDRLGSIEWLKVDLAKIKDKFKPGNEYVKASTGELFVYKDLLR